MKEPTDDKVRAFMQDLEAGDPMRANIVEKLRNIALLVAPEAQEKMMYGGILFSQAKPFCGIFVRKDHITIELEAGPKMNDPDKLLEGTGKERRHITIAAIDDIESKKVVYYIAQAAKMQQ